MRVDDKANPATQPAPAPAPAEEPNPFAILDDEDPSAAASKSTEDEATAAEPAEEAVPEGPPTPEAAVQTEDEKKAAYENYARMSRIEELKGFRQGFSILQFSPSFSASNFYGLAGEPMERMHGSIGITVDFLTKTYENGLRFLVGAYFRGFKDNMAAGARLGFALDVNDRLTLKVPFGLGWVNASGVDDDAGNVPIELSGTGVNADQTAYTFQPHDVQMTMQGGMLSFDPELSINFHRWDLGGGKTLGLGAFVAVSAGLYTGGVSDDECSYAYDPSEGDLEVRPASQGSYEFASTGGLTDRCRAGETTFGTVFSGSAGLTVEFGL